MALPSRSTSADLPVVLEAAAMSQDSVEPADPAVLGLGRAVERLVISLPSSQVPDDFALTVIFHWNGYSDHLHLADL